MPHQSRRLAHNILLSNDEKIEWFSKQIQERQRVKPFGDEQELLAFLRTLRRNFKDIYSRDVPGYFIRKMAERCGLKVKVAPKTKLKMNFAFRLMDSNQNYRDNKSEVVRALELEFGEKTLNYIIDDIWTEWHDRNDHPEPKINVDLHGQGALFDD